MDDELTEDPSTLQPATAVSPYAGRMAELARALRSQRTSLATLQHVVRATAELVEHCDDVAVTVARSDGTVETRASLGTGLAEQADQLQQHLREGPVVDRAWDASVVRAVDLPHDGSWPRWGSAVVDQVGVRSVLCVQLFTHEDRELGALQLFSRRAQAFDDLAVDEAYGIAAQAAVALSAVQNHEALQYGLVRRTMIGQATGIVMERYRLDANQAFEVLRRVSQERNRKVLDLALDLIDGQQLPGV
jgi:transcriptional regulator with GAF, ATPase, and Fis domain